MTADAGGPRSAAFALAPRPAGTPLAIAVESHDFDALLEVRDAAGALVASADGGGLGTDARLFLAMDAQAATITVTARAGTGTAFRILADEALRPLPEGPARTQAEIDYWDLCAERAAARGDVLRQLLALRVAGQLSFSLGRFLAAKERLSVGLAVAEQNKNAGEALFDRVFLGAVVAQLGEADEAFGHFERAAEGLARLASPQPRLHGFLLRQRGDLHLRRGELTQAEEHYQRLHELMQGEGLAEEACWAVGALASARLESGDARRAHELYLRQVDLARALGPEVLAGALLSLGVFHERTGELEIALETLEEAQSLARDPARLADIAGALGITEERLGHLAAARARYTEALDIAQAGGLEDLAAKAQCKLAFVAWSLGDTDTMQQLIASAERRSLSPQQSVWLLLQVGMLREGAGDGEGRLAAQTAALARARELGLVRSQMECLGFVAQARRELGDLAGARREHEAVLDLCARVQDPTLQAVATLGLGYIDLLQGDPHTAIARSQEALETLRKLRQTGAIAAALETVARSWIELGNLDEARAAVDEVAALLAGPELRALSVDEASGWRSRSARWAQTLSQDLALLEIDRLPRGPQRQAAIERGLAGAEAWKHRAMLEASVLRRTSGAGARRLAPELDLALDLDGFRRTVLGPDTVLLEYASGARELCLYVLDAHGLELVRLGERTAITSLVERFQEAIGDVERLGSAREVAALGRELYERIVAPGLAVLEREPGALIVVPSVELAGLPFESLVCGALDRDGVTTFAELEFVLKRFLVVNAPSSRALAEIARTPACDRGGEVVVLADPARTEALAARLRGSSRAPSAELPGARREAIALAAMHLDQSGEGDDAAHLLELMGQRDGRLETSGLRLFLGKDADARRLLETTGYCEILHVGVHGDLDVREPRNTGFWFASDGISTGFVSVGDVMQLDLDVDLAVLSACDTGRGALRAGEGVQSMAMAFLYAGARSVIASLWPVRDLETAALVEGFYAAYLKRGASAPQALREAKLERLRAIADRGRKLDFEVPPTLDPTHPYFWAGIVFSGLPR